MLDREEYVEQAHFFGLLQDRIPRGVPIQEVLAQAKDEVLATTKLILAIDFLLNELNHAGCMSPAMRRLRHYFSPFQAFLVESAEDERGRFDMRIAVQILKAEAEYRTGQPTCPGSFMYQLESLARNRLSYDRGLLAVSDDPIFGPEWREWILTVRRQIGIIDFADLLYVRSKYYRTRSAGREDPVESDKPVLFGDKEGKIAWANRRKDPLFLFAALQRQLAYPVVPRPQPADETPTLVPRIVRRLERIEARIKLMEDEMRQGSADLSRFYGARPHPGEDNEP
ncbi:MAG: hypothetical protein FJ297_12170 [Planctomycetes bacterium]|nr:hypothetical protein [Planctomycetota bacterium]